MKVRTRVRRGAAALLASVALAAAVVVGSASAPASADPGFIQLQTNTKSPQYQVGGCNYKIQYGNYGGAAYAVLWIYNPSSCSGTLISILYNAGSGNQVATTSMDSGYTTGTDSCGAYRVKQITAPVTAYAIAGWASLPGGFDGWAIYSADGLQGQDIHSLC